MALARDILCQFDKSMFTIGLPKGDIDQPVEDIA